MHLFETVLATPRPWLFCTAQLDGGVENLGNPEYSLPGLSDGDDADAPGSKCVLQGTLCEVVSFKRRPNSMITMITQGLTRAVVVRGRQALPFARADVQILADTEAVCIAARRAQRSSNGTGSPLSDAAFGRALLTAAVAEDRCWQAYEFAPIELGRTSPPAFPSFLPEAVVGCSQRAKQLAVSGAPAADAMSSIQEDTVGDGGGGGLTSGEQRLYAASDAVETALQAALRAAEEAEDACDTNEQLATDDSPALEALEIQVWLEVCNAHRTRPCRAIASPHV